MPIERAERTPTVKVEIPQDQFEKYLKSTNTSNVQQADESSWVATVQNLIISGGLLYGAGYVLYQNHDAILEFGRTHVGPLAGRVVCALKVAMQGAPVASSVPLIEPPTEDILSTTARILGNAAGKAYQNGWESYTWFSRLYVIHYFVTNNAPILVTLGAIGGIVTGTITKPFTLAGRVLLPKTNSTASEKVAKVAALALVGVGIILAFGCWDQLQNFAEKGTCVNEVLRQSRMAEFTNAIGPGEESVKQVVGSSLAAPFNAVANTPSTDPGFFSTALAAFINPGIKDAFTMDACNGVTCPMATKELKERVVTFLHDQKKNADTGAQIFTAVHLGGNFIAGAAGSLMTVAFGVVGFMLHRGARLAGAIR